MTPENKQTLRRAAEAAVRAIRERSPGRGSRGDRWELQTSNSFRRIGCYGDGDVVCATTQRDGHPDLLAAPAVLDYIVAAQPEVVLALLDALVLAENKLEAARDLCRRINGLTKELSEVC